ncbi:MAG: HNH endonuclease [Galactobacter sp.]
MTVLDRRPAASTPGMPEVMEALDRAAAAQAEAAALIQEVFGPDGSRVRERHAGRGGLGVVSRFVGNEGGGGSFVDHVPDDLVGLADGGGAVTTGKAHSSLKRRDPGGVTNGALKPGATIGSPAAVGWAGSVSVADLRLVLGRVNRVYAGTDRILSVCADMIVAGSDPAIPKVERINDLLGVRSPEVAVKKYLLTTMKTLRDLKCVRTATTCESFTINAHHALLPVLAEAVAAGAVTLGQAEVISSLLTPLARRKSGVDVGALETVESILVGHATGGRYGTPPETVPILDLIQGRYGLGMHPEELHRLGRQLAELVDQDGPEPADDEVHHKRSLTLKPGKRPGDPAELRAKLTPEAYEHLTTLLAAILDPKTAADPGGVGTGPEVGSGTGAGHAGGAEAGHAGGTGTGTGAGTGTGPGPVSPFEVSATDGVFRLQGEDPVTFAQAQHDAFVTLLGLAGRSAPDQGGAPPRVILLARAEQVLKALTHTPRPGQEEPGVAGSLDPRSQAVQVVDAAVTEAAATLVEAGRAGFLTDAAIKTINRLISLLNDDQALRDDNPTASLRDGDPTASIHHADADTALQTGDNFGVHAHGDGDLQADGGVETGRGGHDCRAGAGCCDVGAADAEGCCREDGAEQPQSSQLSRARPPLPVFGAHLLQDPRLVTSALLPATGATIPLSRLGTILCDAVVEIVTTRQGDLLDYTVAQHRTFTAAQRRVLLTTYATCAVPDCHIPGLRCDAHHVRPASLNGPTSIGNGILLCRHHHTKLHQGHLTLTPRQPGIPGLNATDHPNAPDTPPHPDPDTPR